MDETKIEIARSDNWISEGNFKELKLLWLKLLGLPEGNFQAAIRESEELTSKINISGLKLSYWSTNVFNKA